jgi:IS5 family transposase
MTTTQRHEQQTGKYRELIGIAEEVVDRTRAALKHTRTAHGKDLLSDLALDELRQELERYCGLGERAIDQSRRGVVPAGGCAHASRQ